MKKAIERIWPVPKIQDRRGGLTYIFAPKFIQMCANLERDADYLCYKAAAAVQWFGIMILLAMLFDIALGANLLFDRQEIYERNSLFIGVWSSYVGKFSFACSLITYARIRASINIKAQVVPLIFRRKMLNILNSRRTFIVNSAFVVSVCFILAPFASPLVGAAGSSDILTTGQGNNFLLNALIQMTFMIAFPITTCCGISFALILEKAIRFYPQLEHDVSNYNYTS